MTIAFRNDNKTPLVVPPAIRRKAGFKSGQVLEVKASGGVITILPKLPRADEEYTAKERRAIDAELADAERGASYGPFASADEMIRDLEGKLGARKSAKRTKRAR
jgi:bifunctional DNA-binding transcriptional regulator/antitoxin component of YhaV-PrlF toxin-antitoxin module